MSTNGEDQPKPPLFQRIKAQNLLSFGPDGIDLELGPLNVLIGPNGSGKSNFLEIFSLLKAAPQTLAAPVREGGGVQEWVWKGQRHTIASVESFLSPIFGPKVIRHRLAFFEMSQRLWIFDEEIESFHESSDSPSRVMDFRLNKGKPILMGYNTNKEIEVQRDDIDLNESILSQRKDPAQFPALHLLSNYYERSRLYREWAFGGGTVLRRPQSTEVVSRPMADDFSNAWMFLSRIRQSPSTKSELVEKITDIYEGVTDFDFEIVGSTVRVYFTEGDYTIPATRLSDGSLRFLCILAILLDPEPPPLIALEEPELGIHPDLIHKIADLLIDASTRTQLVVTTHSEILVDALHDRPEAVVVCEKHDGQTTMERLDASKLAIWLEKYRLGDLWTSGQLGGVRW